MPELTKGIFRELDGVSKKRLRECSESEVKTLRSSAHTKTCAVMKYNYTVGTRFYNALILDFTIHFLPTDFSFIK